jgi:hypothetical protein
MDARAAEVSTGRAMSNQETSARAASNPSGRGDDMSWIDYQLRRCSPPAALAVVPEYPLRRRNRSPTGGALDGPDASTTPALVSPRRDISERRCVNQLAIRTPT